MITMLHHVIPNKKQRPLDSRERLVFKALLNKQGSFVYESRASNMHEHINTAFFQL